MKRLFNTFILALLLPLSMLAQESKIEKLSLETQGRKRTYYLFIPKSIKAERPAPLLLLLHGSGRNGLSLVEKWKDVAAKEGIILAGPDSKDSRQWDIPEDGPDLLFELVESLKARYPINPQRVYLFGHSAGGSQALRISVLESEYFAAVAIHAGELTNTGKTLLSLAKRKVPIALFVGTVDPLYPLPAVRATRDALVGGGFTVKLVEIAGHDHNYYGRAEEINNFAWEFLSAHELPAPPRYQQYQFKK